MDRGRPRAFHRRQRPRPRAAEHADDLVATIRHGQQVASGSQQVTHRHGQGVVDAEDHRAGGRDLRMGLSKGSPRPIAVVSSRWPTVGRQRAVSLHHGPGPWPPAASGASAARQGSVAAIVRGVTMTSRTRNRARPGVGARPPCRSPTPRGSRPTASPSRFATPRTGTCARAWPGRARRRPAASSPRPWSRGRAGRPGRCSSRVVAFAERGDRFGDVGPRDQGPCRSRSDTASARISLAVDDLTCAKCCVECGRARSPAIRTVLAGNNASIAQSTATPTLRAIVGILVRYTLATGTTREIPRTALP